ncbi:hypothetical protein CMK20_13605 [Candidatus Poribacteria bacterium]|nr:hypothetical protein [Candidatus Poribacteria bacterium]
MRNSLSQPLARIFDNYRITSWQFFIHSDTLVASKSISAWNELTLMGHVARKFVRFLAQLVTQQLSLSRLSW